MKTSVHMILAVAFLAGTPAAAQDLRSRYEQFLRERTQAYKEYVDARNVGMRIIGMQDGQGKTACRRRGTPRMRTPPLR